MRPRIYLVVGEDWNAVYFTIYSTGESEKHILNKVDFLGYGTPNKFGKIYVKPIVETSPEVIEGILFRLMRNAIPIIVQRSDGILEVYHNTWNTWGLNPTKSFTFKEYSEAMFGGEK